MQDGCPSDQLHAAHRFRAGARVSPTISRTSHGQEQNHDFASVTPPSSAASSRQARFGKREQFRDEDDSGDAKTQVILSQAGHTEEPGKDPLLDRSRASRRLGRERRGRPQPRRGLVMPRVAKRRFGEERERVEASLSAWQLRVPQLRASWDEPFRFVHALGRGPRLTAHPRPPGAWQPGPRRECPGS